MARINAEKPMISSEIQKEVVFRATLEGVQFVGVVLADSKSILLNGRHRYGNFTLELTPAFPGAHLAYSFSSNSDTVYEYSINIPSIDERRYQGFVNGLRLGTTRIVHIFGPLLPLLERAMAEEKNDMVENHDVDGLFDLSNMSSVLGAALSSARLTVMPIQPKPAKPKSLLRRIADAFTNIDTF